MQALTRIHRTDEWLARKQAGEFFSGTPEERQATLALLHQFGVNLEILHADAMSSKSPSIAVLERMIGNRKSSRSKMLRDNDQILKNLYKPIPGSIDEM